MKRLPLLLSVAILTLFGTESFSQVSMDLGIIGRMEVAPDFYFDKTKPEFSCGNSVLYTNMEVSFGEHVNMTWVGHWLDTSLDKVPFGMTKYLYENTWRSDANTWTDFFYFDFLAGGWTFRLGKDVVALGGFEYDAWDWDCTYSMVSLFWQGNAAYQWGGSVIWTTPSEMSEFTLQAIASPYSERPWQNGLGSYSFKYHGEYGPIETSNAINFLGTTPEDKGRGVGYLTLGLKGHIGEKLAISGEWSNRWDTRNVMNLNFFKQSSRSVIDILYTPTPKLSIDFKGGFDRLAVEQEIGYLVELEEELEPVHYGFGGVTVSYCPLRKSNDLKILGTVAGNSFIGKGVSVTLGIIYNHTFHVGD